MVKIDKLPAFAYVEFSEDAFEQGDPWTKSNSLMVAIPYCTTKGRVDAPLSAEATAEVQGLSPSTYDDNRHKVTRLYTEGQLANAVRSAVLTAIHNLAEHDGVKIPKRIRKSVKRALREVPCLSLALVAFSEYAANPSGGIPDIPGLTEDHEHPDVTAEMDASLSETLGKALHDLLKGEPIPVPDLAKFDTAIRRGYKPPFEG